MKKLNLTMVFMVLATAISNLLGLARELILSYKYGTSVIVDIYIVSTNIPILIFSIFVSAVATLFIPTSSKFSEDWERLNIFTNNVLNLTLVITGLIFLFMFVFIEEIVRLYAPGFNKEAMDSTVKLTKIMLLGLFPVGLYMILQNYLTIKEKFIGITFIGAILNFSWILGILYSSAENLVPMAIGNIIGYLTVSIFIFILAKKNGYKYKIILDFKDKGVKKIAKLFTPVFLGLFVTQINGTVERSLASLTGTGSIAIINYSSRLMYVAYGLLVLTFITYVNPKLANIYNKDMVKYKIKAANYLNVLLALMLPLVLSILIYAEEIVTLLFGRGEFDSKDIYLTSMCLRIYIICLVPLGIRELINKYFYISEDTISPLINNIIYVFLNLGLSILLIVILELDFYTLAISMMISNLLATFIYIVVVKSKKIIKLDIDILKKTGLIVLINLVVLIITLLELAYFKSYMSSFFVWISFISYFVKYSILLFLVNLKYELFISNVKE